MGGEHRGVVQMYDVFHIEPETFLFPVKQSHWAKQITRAWQVAH